MDNKDTYKFVLIGLFYLYTQLCTQHWTQNTQPTNIVVKAIIAFYLKYSLAKPPY